MVVILCDQIQVCQISYVTIHALIARLLVITSCSLHCITIMVPRAHQRPRHCLVFVWERGRATNLSLMLARPHMHAHPYACIGTQWHIVHQTHNGQNRLAACENVLVISARSLCVVSRIHHMIVTFYQSALHVSYNIIDGRCRSHLIDWLPQDSHVQRHARSPGSLGTIPRLNQALKRLIVQPPPHQHEGMCARLADLAHDLTSQYFIRYKYTGKL